MGVTSVCSAQPKEVSLDRVGKVALDTLPTCDPSRSVVLYSNNSWNYVQNSCEELSELEVFNTNWETTSIFAYREVELKDLPDVVEVKLMSEIGDYTAPIVGKVFSKYGPRSRYRAHNGVDIPLKLGDPIYATFDGKVRYARYNTGGFGYMVIIRHTNGLETYSAHLCRLNVESGEYVKAGDVIGYGGSTGRSGGPHLHYEVRYKDQAFDPERLIDFESGSLHYANYTLEKSFFSIRSRASEELDDGEDLEEVSEILADADGLPTKRSIAEAEKKAEVYHTIKSGDMLSKLAVRYGVSVSQICRLNGITTKTTLKLGRKLRIK